MKGRPRKGAIRPKIGLTAKVPNLAPDQALYSASFVSFTESSRCVPFTKPTSEASLNDKSESYALPSLHHFFSLDVGASRGHRRKPTDKSTDGIPQANRGVDLLPELFKYPFRGNRINIQLIGREGPNLETHFTILRFPNDP